MGDLPAKKGYRTPPSVDRHADLEELLEGLTAYGRPKLSHLKSGWHAWIEMNVSALGASFEIKSEFDHKSPRAAVTELQSRVTAALDGMR